MLDLDLMNEAQDHAGFIRLPISATHLLGHKASMLLEHLRYVLCDKNFRSSKDANGVLWYKQNRQWLLYYTALSIKEFRTAKKQLFDLGLIQVKQNDGHDRTISWRIDEEVYKRFSAFAYALFCAIAPVNDKTIHVWWEFKIKHPEVVQEFGHLYSNLDRFDPPVGYIPQDVNLNAQKANPPQAYAGDYCIGDSVESEIPGRKKLTLLAGKVKEKVAPGKKERRMDVKPDKYIEYWNSLPNVPRCKIGYAAYEKCRAFFRAFKEYKAGSELFPLDTQLQKDIQLKTINRSSRRAPKCGPKQIPMRPDEEMFEWIKVAANAYSPDYVPVDKSHLPKSLYQFLYNDHSPKHGQYSIFLEKLWVNPPLTIDEDTYERLWNHADDDVQEMYILFQEWYNIANGRDREARFSLKDHKRLLSIAKDWCDYYYNDLKEAGYVMPGSIEIPYFKAYVSYIRDVAPVNDFYDGMPLGTFKKCGQFWKIVLGEDSCIDY